MAGLPNVGHDTVPPFDHLELGSYSELRQTILSQFPPHGERPQFDIPRFWSNPSLDDPDRIIALVLAKPTVADLARIIHAYGPDRIVDCLNRLIADQDLNPQRQAYATHLFQISLEGVADAAHQLAAS